VLDGDTVVGNPAKSIRTSDEPADLV
jgi:hypothetical protein